MRLWLCHTQFLPCRKRGHRSTSRISAGNEEQGNGVACVSHTRKVNLIRVSNIGFARHSHGRSILVPLMQSLTDVYNCCRYPSPLRYFDNNLFSVQKEAIRRMLLLTLFPLPRISLAHDSDAVHLVLGLRSSLQIPSHRRHNAIQRAYRAPGIGSILASTSHAHLRRLRPHIGVTSSRNPTLVLGCAIPHLGAVHS
jgi:hypothetical protein